MKRQKRTMNFYRKQSIVFSLFALPQTILYIMFFIAPIICGIFYSFTDYNGINKKLNFVGWSNYKTVFSNSRFTKALLFNAKYSTMLVICILALSMILALILNSNLKGKTFFRGAFFFPAVLPLLTMGLVFNSIITKGIPQLGTSLGFKSWEISLLSRPKTAILAILFVAVWQGLAIPTVLFMAGLQTVPEELLESASLDGATAWQKFRYITIPFLVPTITMVFVLTLKQGLMVFDLIMSMTQGGPAGATESMAMLIYNHGFVERRLSVAMAEALILATIVCVVSFVQIVWSNRKRIY